LTVSRLLLSTIWQTEPKESAKKYKNVTFLKTRDAVNVQPGFVWFTPLSLAYFCCNFGFNEHPAELLGIPKGIQPALLIAGIRTI